jgi:hypothetical protein
MISSAPTITDGPYGPRVEFARSREIRVRIPRVPAPPSVSADIGARRLNSIRRGSLEWSLTGSENPGDWHLYERSETSLPFSEVLSAFAGLGGSGADEDGNYALYFRTRAAAGRSPASPPKMILIPSELCR